MTNLERENRELAKEVHELSCKIEELEMQIAELSAPVLDCPYCGTTELLCGYPNKCCVVKDEE